MTRHLVAGLAGLVLAGAAAAYAVIPPKPAGIDGYARVIDGDTIAVNGTRVRLFGIDSPEINQRCGGEACGLLAKAALERMTRNAVVTCVERDRDRYGRVVAQCATLGGDLGARLVALGLATAYRRYSLIYADHEDAARAEKLGIWAARFTPPEQYRRDRR